MITEITLTTEQQQAVDKAVESLKAGRLFKVGGYAGTGKTTVAKNIVEQLENVMCCAFTGKAAYRLREKGLDNTATIHRTIYDYNKFTKTFNLKPDVDGNYFLIDESSMISRDLWRDIQTFGRPVLLLGDPGQLEPVGFDPKLMHEPDIILQQIHRQAAGSGIIQFATNIRLGSHTPDIEYNSVDIVRKDMPHDDDLLWADIVLCGYNRNRLAINRRIRRLNGFKGLLEPGERIIVLRNNIQLGVFNGQILTVEEVFESGKFTTPARCLTDDGESMLLPLLNKQFGNASLETQGNDLSEIVLADYGYCITCHKSQGSEWDNVIVIDEQCPKLWNPTRWRYTAITRAAKNLKYYVPK